MFFVLDPISSFRPFSSVLSYFVLLCVLCGGQIRVKYSLELLCVLCAGSLYWILEKFKFLYRKNLLCVLCVLCVLCATLCYFVHFSIIRLPPDIQIERHTACFEVGCPNPDPESGSRGIDPIPNPENFSIRDSGSRDL